MGKKVLKTGDDFGPYQVVQPLGSGVLADSYLVQHMVEGTGHVFKIFTESSESHPEFSEALLAQAKTLRGLSHPNLVKVEEVGTLDGYPFIRTEYVPGFETQGYTCVHMQHLAYAYDGKLPEELLLGLLEGVIDGLVYAHEQGLLHLDLKPSNIMLAGVSAAGSSSRKIPCRVKLADVGLASILGEEAYVLGVHQAASREEETPAVLAARESWNYMAPELRDAYRGTEQSDLYTLGLVMFRMVTGVEEFDFENPVTRGLPHNWEILVRNCLRDDPGERLGAVREIRQTLQRIAERVADPPRAASRPAKTVTKTPAEMVPTATRTQTVKVSTLPPPRAPKKKKNTGLIVLQIVGLVLALVVFVGWLVVKDRPELVPWYQPPADEIQATERNAAVDPVMEARAAAERVKAEKALEALNLDQVDDGQDFVLYKREIEDHQIVAGEAFEARNWDTAIQRYQRIAEVAQELMILDEARSKALKAREKASEDIERLRATTIPDADAERWEEAGGLFYNTEEMFNRREFEEAQAAWERCSELLDLMEESAEYSERYFEQQALYTHRVTKRKALLDQAGGQAWNEMQAKALEAEQAPPHFKKGFEQYDELLKQMESLLDTIQHDKDEARFKEHFEAAKSHIENKEWRDAFASLSSAMVLNVPEQKRAREMYTMLAATNRAGDLREVQAAGISISMAWIPPTVGEGWKAMSGGRDTFEMGVGQSFRKAVKIPMGYWMGRTEVTQGQWEKVMGENPSHFKNGPDYPVDSVSWSDCQAFIQRLNESVKGEFKFRLPSDAEWEYACRAGTSSKYFSGGTAEDLDRVAWYWGNARGQSHLVSTRGGPNPWKLSDMHGNLWEWCDDHWYASLGANPGNGGPFQSRMATQERVLRGGAWISRADKCTSTYRRRLESEKKETANGLRLVFSR